MSWWSRLTGGKNEPEPTPDRRAPDRKGGRTVDYLAEALGLERQGDYDAALTSYRLALRDQPNDQRVLQNMAITYSKLGQQEEAIRCYRRVLDVDPSQTGAHYGIAFLLLKRGDRMEATRHLEQFLEQTPQSPDTQKWVEHASSTLAQLRDAAADAEDSAGWPPERPRA